MKKYLAPLFLLLAYTAFSQNNYEKAWKALNENKRTEAASLLAEAEKDPAFSDDAYITGIYLKSYNGKEGQIRDFDKSFYTKAANPYPYIYALWFNNAVVGNAGKKAYDHQVKLVDELIEDKNAPGTMVASANYQRGLHTLFSQ